MSLAPAAPELCPDAGQIQAFINYWFSGCTAGRIGVAWSSTTTGRPNYQQNFPLGDQTIGAFAAEKNKIPGVNLYYVIATVSLAAPKRTSDSHFVQCPGLAIDQDTLEQLAHSANVTHFVRPTAKVVTGRHPSQREQNLFKCTEPLTNPEQVQWLLQRVAGLYQGDPECTNCTTLLRMPGTINWPDKKKAAAGRIPEMTFGAVFDDGRPTALPLAMLETGLAGVPPVAPRERAQKTADELAGMTPAEHRLEVSECIARILADDHWHSHTVSLVAHKVSLGESDAEIQLIAPAITTAGFTVEETRHDLQIMIDGARRKFMQPDPAGGKLADRVADARAAFAGAPGLPMPQTPVTLAAPKLRLYSLAEAASRMSRSADYLIDGILPRACLALISGLPMAGKSPVAHDMVARAALATAWAGHAVPNRVRTVFFAGESQQQAVMNLISCARRVMMQAAIAAYPGDKGRRLSENITDEIAMAALDGYVHILIDSAYLQTDTDLMIEAIMDATDGQGCDLRVYDTLRALSTTSANNDEDLAVVQTRFKQMQTAFPNTTDLILHHATKADPMDASGSNRLVGMCDIVMAVTPVDRGSAAGEDRIVKVPQWTPVDAAGGRHYSLNVWPVRNKIGQIAEPIRASMCVKGSEMVLDYGVGGLPPGAMGPI